MKACNGNCGNVHYDCLICRQEQTERAVNDILPRVSLECVDAESILAEALQVARRNRMKQAGLTFKQNKSAVADFFNRECELRTVYEGHHAYLVLQDGELVGVQLHEYRTLPPQLIELLEERGYAVHTTASEGIYNPGVALAIRITRR